MKKRTKIIILVLMVALLGVTGYLNIALNNNIQTGGGGQTSNLGYFASYREDRKAARDQEIAYYDAIIASSASSAEAKANAEASKDQIVKLMEKELIMEGLIKAKGFEDVIVTNSATNVNIVVKSAELSKQEVAQIVAVVKQQTGINSIENIKIIPVE